MMLPMAFALGTRNSIQTQVFSKIALNVFAWCLLTQGLASG
jgi:hypothetical protein